MKADRKIAGPKRSPESRGIAEIDNRRDWAQMIQSADAIGNPKATSRVPEARYAYYRRCQKFRRNGEQCKAPAVKGETICYRHAEQADMERRRQAQRRDLLSRPGVGFGSFAAIQVTLSELAAAILAGSIDQKVSGRLLVDIQQAIRLQKMLAAVARRCRPLPMRTVKPVIDKKEVQEKETRRAERATPTRTAVPKCQQRVCRKPWAGGRGGFGRDPGSALSSMSRHGESGSDGAQVGLGGQARGNLR